MNIQKMKEDPVILTSSTNAATPCNVGSLNYTRRKYQNFYANIYRSRQDTGLNYTTNNANLNQRRNSVTESRLKKPKASTLNKLKHTSRSGSNGSKQLRDISNISEK